MLEQLDSERAAFDRLLVEVGVERMTAPVEGGWSVKDIVTHIMAYDRWWAAQIRSAIRGTLAIDHERDDSDGEPESDETFDLDQRNASIQSRYQNWPLDKVLRAAQDAFATLRWTIEEAPAALWNAPLDTGWSRGDRLQDVIRQQIIDHCREHAPALRSWIMQDEGLTSGPDEPVEAEDEAKKREGCGDDGETTEGRN